MTWLLGKIGEMPPLITYINYNCEMYPYIWQKSSSKPVPTINVKTSDIYKIHDEFKCNYNNYLMK